MVNSSHGNYLIINESQVMVLLALVGSNCAYMVIAEWVLLSCCRCLICRTVLKEEEEEVHKGIDSRTQISQ